MGGRGSAAALTSGSARLLPPAAAGACLLRQRVRRLCQSTPRWWRTRPATVRVWRVLFSVGYRTATAHLPHKGGGLPLQGQQGGLACPGCAATQPLSRTALPCWCHCAALLCPDNAVTVRRNRKTGSLTSECLSGRGRRKRIGQRAGTELSAYKVSNTKRAGSESRSNDVFSGGFVVRSQADLFKCGHTRERCAAGGASGAVDAAAHQHFCAALLTGSPETSCAHAAAAQEGGGEQRAVSRQAQRRRGATPANAQG